MGGSGCTVTTRRGPGALAALLPAALVALLVTACGQSEAPTDAAAPASKKAPAAEPDSPAAPAGDAPAVVAAGISLPATFAGQLPCADCGSIDTTLTLEPDFRFRLRSTYQGKPPGQDTVVDAGRFAVSDAGQRIALYGATETASIFAVQTGNTLTRLDTSGQPITSQSNYSLKLAPAVDRIVEPARTLGLFTYLADAASFVDCNTEQRLPVAKEVGYPDLERAYVKSNAQGAARLARLRSHVELKPGMEESQGPRPTLVVDAFEGLVGGATQCQRPRAPLQGTRWVLTKLGGTPVAPDASNVPTLVLEAAGERLGGSTGCNSMSGGYDYSATTGALTIGAISTTRMACPPGGIGEADYTQAVQRATSATIAGEVLTLADDQAELATFRADYPRPDASGDAAR